MRPKRAFISSEFDHDHDLFYLLTGLAKHPDTPLRAHRLICKSALEGLPTGAGARAESSNEPYHCDLWSVDQSGWLRLIHAHRLSHWLTGSGYGS